MAHYLGVDLGASNVRAAVGDDEAAIVGRARTQTPTTTGIEITEAVLDLARAACAEAGVDPGEVVAGAVGSIGPLDLAEGLVDGPANLPDSVGQVPLVGPLSTLIDGEVYLHNDTAAGVIGERFFAERNPDDMVYLTISSGVGAGVAVDGRVIAGWDGNAGEVGHVKVDPAGRMECGCGRAGHWEAYCSGNNIPRYARELHDGEATSLPIEGDLTAADVYDHADGDEFAARVVERVGEWNALGVANVAVAYAPLVVYVGGAVALNNPEKVLGPIRDKIPDLTFVNVPEVRLSALGDDVVVKGAVASAMTEGTGDRARLRR
ncbi:MAG: ROK family protein [Haloferacaceae archaeon]